MQKKTKKKKRKPTAVEIRLEALEIRLGRYHEAVQQIAAIFPGIGNQLKQILGDYRAVGKLAEMVSDLDVSLFATFRSTQDLVDMLKAAGVDPRNFKGAVDSPKPPWDYTTTPALVVDRLHDLGEQKPLQGR